jgi:hypothetical protein
MKTYISLIISILLLSSCSSLLYTSIDVLKPAVVSFDASAQNILLVNNTLAQPDYYGHKNEFYNQSTKYVKVNTDSLPLFVLSMLSEKLTDNGFFGNVDLVLNSVNNDSDFFATQNLSFDKVKNLCKTYDADVVLSLDRLKVNDVIGDVYYQDINTYYVALVARYEARWSVLYPSKNTRETYTFRDTIYWEGENTNRQKAHLQLPDRADALVDGALYAGENVVKRLMPYWTKSDRYFFSSNKKEMKQGLDSIYAKNWSGAIKVWGKAIENASNSYKGQLAYNLAVAYELDGDINKALQYVWIAYEYLKYDYSLQYEHPLLLNDYMKELNVRKADIDLIRKQLGE